MLSFLVLAPEKKRYGCFDIAGKHFATKPRRAAHGRNSLIPDQRLDLASQQGMQRLMKLVSRRRGKATEKVGGPHSKQFTLPNKRGWYNAVRSSTGTANSIAIA